MTHEAIRPELHEVFAALLCALIGMLLWCVASDVLLALTFGGMVYAAWLYRKRIYPVLKREAG